jgi:DNA-binding transcriptional regulator YiaG
MSNKQVKIIDEYRADELGLPVLIKRVPIIEIDGREVMDIDYTKISEVLFAALIIKPFPLTGAEVRFMRLFMGLTLENLANSLHVTHPTILSWEKCGNEPTKMTDSTEAILRIFAAKQGSKDNELIGVILNRFFGGPSKTNIRSKSATIIELDPTHKGEIPKIHFSDQEKDLRLVREA